MAKQKLIVAGVSTFCIFFLGMSALIGWQRAANCPPLPPLEDISGIRIRCFYDNSQHKEVDFDVPEADLREFVAALSPYEKDQSPAAWKILACMDVATKSGKKYGLLLFQLDNDSVGAFAFWNGRTDVYYRGGNSIKLKQAIVKACEKSKNGHK